MLKLDVDWLDHDRLGYNYRLSEIACALSTVQLGRLAEILEQRARVASLCEQALQDLAELELPCPDQGGDVRGWFVFVVQLPREVSRAGVIQELSLAGIRARHICRRFI
jgi:perosamine synthetase